MQEIPAMWDSAWLSAGLARQFQEGRENILDSPAFLRAISKW